MSSGNNKVAAPPAAPPAPPAAGPAPTFSEIMNKSAASAIRGGTAGALAMGANVAALMWMRTTVSFKLSTFFDLSLPLTFMFYIRFPVTIGRRKEGRKEGGGRGRPD